jgi:dTMP kinase
VKALFITFEGIDGSGKSTQVAKLGGFLKEAGLDLTLIREPGDTAVSESLRAFLLDHGNEGLDPRAEVMLFSAARAQLVAEIIEPALAAGNTVICDRFADSTIAYQGYGRELPLEEIIITQRLVTRGLNPDLTVLLDLSVEASDRRRKPSQDDRMESAGNDFLERVRSGYLTLAAKTPNRWLVIDAAGDVDQIAGEIAQHVHSKHFA